MDFFKPGVVTATLLRWGAGIFVVLALTVIGPALDAISTELETAQDVADQVEDVGMDAARVEEIVATAKQANPKLTDEELSRVRAAAMYLVTMRPAAAPGR